MIVIFRRLLKKWSAEKAGLKGLVLDLRNNPGGLLTQAVRIADLFLDSGMIVYTEGRIESQKQKYFAQKDGSWMDFPIVVLVNGGVPAPLRLLRVRYRITNAR